MMATNPGCSVRHSFHASCQLPCGQEAAASSKQDASTQLAGPLAPTQPPSRYQYHQQQRVITATKLVCVGATSAAYGHSPPPRHVGSACKCACSTTHTYIMTLATQ